MVQKKLDNRIRTLIENGVAAGHRTMFMIVGDKAKDQVVLLHHILLKSSVKPNPKILWCYKKELDFSSHRKKKMKSLQKKAKSGKLNFDEDDPFDLFILSTKIRYCYYSETHKILGNTYDMCILQDFEALTPNLLARTIETVQGGGIIVFLLQSMKSLKELYAMNMDVHQRFRTEAHNNVVCRFNERFLLSLSTCQRCLVVDDQLKVLPISSHNLNIKSTQKNGSEDMVELDFLKKSLQDTQPIGSLINCCKTTDQAKVLLKFIEAISEKTLRSTISLTAARGRGKSAALGLAIAGAVAFGYSNIYVTSPSPENLSTLFEFISKGFEALNYEEKTDFQFFQSSNPEFNKATVRVNIYRDHRQTIQYIHPTDVNKLNQAELLVIDEAAAIPLPYVKALLGPYLTFLASTINGYEGTGRSLSLKLLQQLRSQTVSANTADREEKEKIEKAVLGRELHELKLNEPIRYKSEDCIEKWLSDLLCLDATVSAPVYSGCPPPDQCQLYYINRDTLFSYHKASELFLQRIVALFVSSHYKNTPNDLQMMSDAPAHHLFCLLGPIDPDRKSLPEVLVVIQVCLEGQINKSTISESLGRGRRAAGDLIPWTIAQQYQDENFPSLCGARIVRIATHPDYQGIGYGTKALELLRNYYEHKMQDLEETSEELTHITEIQEEEVNLLNETIEPRKSLPSLLLKLHERSPEYLDYLGVSFGVTEQLLKFWKRAKYTPVYLRQTPNEITGEYSCIMLTALNENSDWLDAYWKDFRRRFITLLSSSFRDFPSSLALSILVNNNRILPIENMEKFMLDTYFTSYDIARLEKYGNNTVDYHLIMDLVPLLSRLYFLNCMGDTHFTAVQKAILLSLGLQHKTVTKVVQDLNQSANNKSNVLLDSQVLGLFNKIIRKCVKYLHQIIEENINDKLVVKDFEESTKNVQISHNNALEMNKELELADKELKRTQKSEFEKLKRDTLKQYEIKGSESDWQSALTSVKGSKTLLSVKSIERKKTDSSDVGNMNLQENLTKNKIKGKKRKHNM